VGNIDQRLGGTLCIFIMAVVDNFCSKLQQIQWLSPVMIIRVYQIKGQMFLSIVIIFRIHLFFLAHLVGINVVLCCGL
jgi:uncharacterized membrane protein YqhA